MKLLLFLMVMHKLHMHIFEIYLVLTSCIVPKKQNKNNGLVFQILTGHKIKLQPNTSNIYICTIFVMLSYNLM
jgi:hypothetical protein